MLKKSHHIVGLDLIHTELRRSSRKPAKPSKLSKECQELTLILDTFVKRLQNGKANNLIYSDGDKEGLVSVWIHEEAIILTWEECPIGEQHDESTYSRDERHVFESIGDLMTFLASNALKPELFTP